MERKKLDQITTITNDIVFDCNSYLKALLNGHDDEKRLENNFIKEMEKHLQELRELTDIETTEVAKYKTVNIILKNCTGSIRNQGLLDEISKDTGLKEGDIIHDAQYQLSNNSCHFSVYNVIKVDCCAWVGETCEIM